MEDLSKYKQGFVSSSETQRGNNRLLTLWWPSLFKSYRLQLQVESNNRITAIDTANMSITPVAGSARQPDPVSPPGGSDNVFLLKLADNTGSSRPLAAELIRQGFFIAAEREFGLTIYDRTIGDTIPQGETPGKSFSLAVSTTQHDKMLNFHVSLIRISTGVLVTPQPVKLQTPEENWVEGLVDQVESATHTSFAEAFEQAGYKRSARATKVESQPALLHDRLDFVTQFARVRQLHERLRMDGDSPVLLGDLVRAYANLGSVCDFHWSASSRVFKARALLYAERLVGKTGETPFSLAHRAYARALSGRHGTALAAVSSAKSAQGQAAPDWLELIDAYCNHKPAVLDGIGGAQRELAYYLRMRMTDRPSDEARALQVSNQYLSVNPACCRAVDWLAEMPGLGPQRMTIETGFAKLWPEVYSRLTQVSDLPADVKKIAATAMKAGSSPQQEYASRTELVRLLRHTASNTGATNGPTWGVLAELIHDVTFVQAWRTLRLEADTLGINADPSLKKIRPLVKDHRLGKFLENFGSDRENARKAMGELMASFEWNRMNTNAFWICTRVGQLLSAETASRATRRTMDLADPFYEDIARVHANWPGYHETYKLIDISPEWPQSAALSIATDWENVKTRSKEWQEKFSDDPCVLNQLAWKLKDEQPDDAIRCIKKSIRIVPTIASHRTLAEIYKNEGETALWRATLTAALKLPSFGLEENNLHSSLAYDNMRRKEWNQAWPHAIAAAEGYSAHGLMTAAQAAEGLQDWKKAEAYVRACAERYSTSADQWYFWCVRTGRGNMKQAKSLAEQSWKTANESRSGQMWQIATGHIVARKIGEARTVFEANVKRHGNLASMAFAALLADQEHDTAACDEWFKKLASKWNAENPYPEFSNLAQGVISGEARGRWNPHNFEHIIATAAESEVPYLNYLAGVLLIQHGEQALGREYLKQAASAFDVFSLACILATDALRKEGIAIPENRSHEWPDDIAKAAWLLRRATTAQGQGNPKRALALFDQALKEKPNFLTGLNARGDFYFELEQHSDAIADYEAAIAVDPDSYISHLNLAWILASGESAEHRNGEKALIHAERAVALRQFDVWTSEVVLAAAHAECGHFDEAIKHEKRASALPECDLSEPRLASYMKREPYHQVSKKNSTTQEPTP
jgi:tetratricopeptide (TPR) repeat protein